MSLKTYDVRDITVTVNGNIISGYASDAVVEIEPNSDNYTSFTGADGDDHTRSRNNDKAGMIRITLAQTSLSNSVLNGLRKLDRQDNSGTFDISVDAPDGSYTGVDAYINIDPTATYTNEAGNRVWEIMVPVLNADYFGQSN